MNFTSIRALSFKAPQIDSEATANHYKNLTAKLERFVNRVGKNSSMFRIRREELFRAAYAKSDMVNAVESTAYIRPLLDLWSNESEFIKMTPPTPPLMNRLTHLLEGTPRKRLGRLAIREACQLFFQYYTTIPEIVGPYRLFLLHQLRRYNSNELNFGLNNIHRNAGNIIQPEGHIWFVRRSATTHRLLPDLANQYGVITKQSSFFQECQIAYYITKINALHPNEEDDILDEVRPRKVHNTPYKKGRLLGHAIAAALIDKLTAHKESPSDRWLQTILSIAGDPRIPPDHHRYVKWWSQLGPKRMAQMRRWLSRFDMNLFLEIVEAFSETKGGDDMERMFPKRKRFLEGLFNSGMVDEAQLFLHSRPEQYLRASLRENDILPYFRKLTGQNSNLTVFYFRMGNVHLIEGTHNFALTILDKIPDNCPAGKFDTRAVDSRSLGKGVEDSYFAQFKTFYGLDRIIHYPSKWVGEAYKTLQRFGINIDPHSIMDPEDYRRLYL